MAATTAASPSPAGAAGGAPGAAGPTPFASASLYVGDLAAEVTESLLFEIFNAVGPVASVRVCRDAATRRSLGYAYVNFHRIDDAERALDTMNFSHIRGEPCRIMWSHRDPALRKSGQGNIFVKNLARSIDNKSLYDTFSMFGNILSCKVAQNSKGDSLGYGFVHYESDEAAATAIARVDGMVIASEKVNVVAFKSRKERGGGTENKFTNVYVKNLPETTTKADFDGMFKEYGSVTSSMLSYNEEEQKCLGFGFVNFADADEAAAAVEAKNNSDTGIEGKKLYVGRAQKKEEREKELRQRFEQLKQERQKKYAGVNLYVKNLSDDIDDDRLRETFAAFGAITSAKIMRDKSEKTRGFGFVCFSTPEEATKAVTEMNGKMLDAKPLYVSLAQRKEVRRQELEQRHAARNQKLQQQGMYPGQGMGPPGAPMYFQSMPPQRSFVYPQQVVPRGWTPAGQPGARPGVPGQQLMSMGRQPINYQLMPMNGAGARGPSPSQRGNQRGGRGGGGGRGQQQKGGPAQQQGQNFKYAQNVRNRDGGQPLSPQGGAAPASTGGTADAQQPLTIQALAAAPKEQQKQMIGERLFPLIATQQPSAAGKITGMLLEMDNGELLHLLESETALNEKITEALSVLAQKPSE